MSDERIPAEVFHVGEFIEDEMAARGWTSLDLALRMGGKTAEEIGLDRLSVDLLCNVHHKDLLMGEKMAAKIAAAFGSSPEYWINLDKAWRDQQPCPK